MLNKRKKLLTKIFSLLLASIWTLQTTAGAATLTSANNVSPLKASTNNVLPAYNQNSSAINLKGGVAIDGRNQRVTLSLSKADVRQVLRMLADKAGKNIVIDDSVPQVMRIEQTNTSGAESLPAPPVSVASQTGDSQAASGEITLDLVNVTVNKAFEYIMTVKELTYWLDGNTIIVASNKRAAELGINKTEIKTLKIKYVDAQKVADFLNDNIFSVKALNKPESSKSEIVTSNPSTNEIYIFGNNNDFELAKKIVAKLDIEPQMKTYNVNYANPNILAQKICMTVFHNTDSASGSSSSGSPSGASSSAPTSVSQLTTVCSGKSGSSDSSSGSSSGTNNRSSNSSSSNNSSGSSGSSSSGSNSLTPFDSPSYTVLADNGLNQITIYGGTTEQVNLATQLIKNFDKKEPQVYLEISIIELSEDGSKEFQSVMYSIGQKQTGKFINGTTRFEFTTTGPISGTSSDVADVFQNLETYGAWDHRMGAIQAIISKSKGRLLANPRIIASNNVESTIDITEQIVSSVTTQVVTGASSSSSKNVNHGDVGIKLNVTPKISANGYVTLNLEPTYSSVKGSDGNGGTLTRSRNFTSENVRVKDGETLVIAGLIQESENNTQQKTPLLADIPVIGTLFKNQSTAKGRSELIFMITPRIIKDDDNTESI